MALSISWRRNPRFAVAGILPGSLRENLRSRRPVDGGPSESPPDAEVVNGIAGRVTAAATGKGSSGNPV
jgi:hypothetical protein